MKIKIGIEIALLVLIVLLVPSVFAASQAQFVQDVIDGIKGVWQPIFSVILGIQEYDEFFFEKMLLFFLLFVLIRAGVKATPALGENKVAVIIISLVVSLFAVRFISSTQIIEGILLPYGALGIALAVVLPFLIFFFFVEKTIKSPTGRKIAWLFYLIVLSGMWFYQAPKIDPVGHYIYLGATILAICLLLFDKKVQEYFGMVEVKEMEEAVKAERIAEAVEKYRIFAEAYMRSAGMNKAAKKTANKYAKLLRKWKVDVKDIE